MLKRSILVLALALGTASAQDKGRPFPDTLRHAQDNRPAIALGLGALGIAAPFAVGIGLFAGGANQAAVDVLLAGLIFAPSAGEWYAGAPIAPWVGAGVRAAAVGMIAYGAEQPKEGCGSDDFECGWHPPKATKWGMTLLTLGCLGSLIDGPMAVGRSDKRKASAGIRTSFAPVLQPVPEGGWAMGGAASVRF